MSPHPQTGPKTDEGKARSAQNAVKHGLLCTFPIVTPENEQHFDRLSMRLLSDLSPGTATEIILYKEIVTASWNLHRIGEQKRAIFTETKQDPLNCTDPAVQARYDRLDRYHARNERTLHRTIKLYQQLQTSRGALAIDKDALPANIPPMAHHTLLSKRNAQKKAMRDASAHEWFAKHVMGTASRTEMPTGGGSRPPKAA